jgi:hypothetical protein
MKKLFAYVIAMAIASTAMAEQTIVGANFYGMDKPCESGTKIQKGSELARNGVTFTLDMGEEREMTVWIAFEVTREDDPSVVLVKWIAPKKELAHCQDGEFEANIPSAVPNGETYHSRACRTLSVKTYEKKDGSFVTYDCKGKWTVQLCDKDGNVLSTANGSKCEYFVVVK